MYSNFVLAIATIELVGVYSTVLYGAYWAFTIRRALAVRLYRRQALQLDLFAAYFLTLPLLILSLNPNFPASGDPIVNFFGGAFYYFGYVMVFAWVDATVRVARLSDPLLRDTLHWRKLRRIVWALAALGTAEVIGLSLSLILTYTVPSVVENLVLFVPILAIVSSGAPALILSARRSKDTTLRRHLKWFGLFVGVFISSNTAGFVLLSLGLLAASGILDAYYLAGLALSLVAAYSFYRSARSLAPIGHLPPVDTKLLAMGPPGPPLTA